MKTFRCLTEQQASKLAAWLVNLPLPFTVTVKDGEGRTLSQNALLHKWFGEIASHQGDVDALDVKGMCHRKWGLVIKLRDPQFAWVWKHSGERLPYEKQCALLASGVLNVSSSMTTAELSEYMDGMGRQFRAQGIRLTDPEIMRQGDQHA